MQYWCESISFIISFDIYFIYSSSGSPVLNCCYNAPPFVPTYNYIIRICLDLCHTYAPPPVRHLSYPQQQFAHTIPHTVGVDLGTSSFSCPLLSTGSSSIEYVFECNESAIDVMFLFKTRMNGRSGDHVLWMNAVFPISSLLSVCIQCLFVVRLC